MPAAIEKKRPRIVVVSIMIFFGVIFSNWLRDWGFIRWLVLLFTALYTVVGFLALYFDVCKRIKEKCDGVLPWMLEKGIGYKPRQQPGGIVGIAEVQLAYLKKNLLEKVMKRCEATLHNDLIVRAKNPVERKVHFESRVMACDAYQPAAEYTNAPFKNTKYLLMQKDALRDQSVKVAVVGEPGQGKTRYLAEWILQDCEQLQQQMNGHEFKEKVPVFISLAGWTSEKILSYTELAGWLADAFVKQYERLNGHINQSLDADIVQFMFEKGHILPFLDGLDEVPEGLRVACLQSIINFPTQVSNIVFSCRYTEFNPLLDKVDEDIDAEHPERQERLRLKVYHLQPVEEEDVRAMIIATQENAKQMLAYLDRNRMALDYINKPLYFHLFVLSFDKLDKQEPSAEKTDVFEDIMWREYENVMLNEKMPEVPYTTHLHLRKYLLVLAQKLDANNQHFFVDRLQPLWLGHPRAILFYYLVSRILSGTLLSVAIGFFLAGPWDFIGVGIVASVVVTFLTVWINRYEANRKPLKWSLVFIYPFSLIVITGLFQGFAVPRDTDQDMLGAFSKTEALSGILLGTFLGVIFGFRKMEQSKAVDIKPVHNSVFKWGQALRMGLSGGFVIGLFIALAAYLVYEIIPTPTFNLWFKDTIGGLALSLEQKLHVKGWLNNEFALVFIFPLVVGMYVGFLVFAIIGGRARDENKEAVQVIDPTARLNDGIIRSFFNSLKYGSIVFLLVSVLYGAFVYLISGNTEGMVRAAKIGLGMAFISYLWYGGFEYIQHWTLRFCLYGYGILPWNFTQWAETAQKLTYVVRSGHSLQFFHAKLKDYYLRRSQEKMPAEVEDSLRRKRKHLLRFIRIFFSTGIVLVMLPFIWRFASFRFWHYYWQSPNHLLQRVDTLPLKRLNDSTVLVLKSDTFFLHVRGKVHAGTFTGSVFYRGTNTGLLGFPLGAVYNVDSAFRHAALLYKKNNGAWGYLTDSIYIGNAVAAASAEGPDFSGVQRLLVKHGIIGGKDVIRLRLHQRDTLHFRVNDNEYENNSGSFRIIYDSTTSRAQ